MDIILDDLSGSAIRALLQEHLDDMASDCPPESMHALDSAELTQDNVRFWSAWKDEQLAGCAALYALDRTHAELKSMRTASNFLRKGVAAELLSFVIEQARQDGHKRISLETGSSAQFIAARELYKRFGFDYCEPFAEYQLDSNSVYMTLTI